MNRSLLAAAAALFVTVTSTTVALAAYSNLPKITDLKTSGGWSAFHVAAGNGPALCGMGVNSNDRQRSLMVKYSAQGNVFVQAFKSSWKFNSGVKLNVWINFDGGEPFYGVATTQTADGPGFASITVVIRRDNIGDFLKQFAASNKLNIGFPDGNEQSWYADLTGSGDITPTFIKCASYIDGNDVSSQPVPTQPYRAPQATQPYGKPQATQPFGNARPAQQPTRRDDGGI